MRSTRGQLLVTLAATLVAAGFFVHRGLPPHEALFDAVYAEDCCQVRRALAWGADPDGSQLQWGWRSIAVFDMGQLSYAPLHWAVEKRRTDIVTLLLDAGADVNVKAGCWYELRPVDVNEKGWARGQTWVLLGSERTALHMAAQQGDEATVAALVAAGAQVNAEDKDGVAPVDLAVSGGHEAIVKFLREHGSRGPKRNGL